MSKRWFTRRRFLASSGATMAATAFPAQTRAAPSSVAKLFVTEAGSGRPVMLLHGWTADGHDWSWQLPALERRFRTVVVDLRGHGRSEVMPSGHYRPEHFVSDIETLIDSGYRGQPFIMIGHSMGAQVAARLAAKRPDVVDAVISVDGALGFSADLAPLFRRVSQDLHTGDVGAVAPALFADFYDSSTPASFRRWHARRVQGMPAHVVKETFAPLFIGGDQVGVGPESETFLRRLQVPVYHLCRDGAQAGRMRRCFLDRRSRVDVWANAGHWIMQDRPEEVNAAMIAWIETLGSHAPD